MDSQAARFVVAHQTSDTRRESSGSSLSEGISPDSSFAIDNSPAQTHLKTSSSTAGQSTNVPDTSGAMEEDGRNDGTIKSPKKGPIRHNPFSPVPLPTTQSSPPTIAIQGSTYEPRHSFSSSIDSTTSSFSSFNHSPGDQSSINPSNASPSRQSYQSNQSQRAASGNYRGTSPTPSDVSTRSTRNRFATVSPSMPDPTRGREKRRTTTRKARLENSSAAPYSYTSSRESSLGPGLEQNAGGHYDGGLSELMAEARVEDRRRDFGYESSNWSDGSADIEVDTPADADYVQSRSKGKGAKDDRSSDEEDGDFDMEERPTTAVVKKESPKKRGPYKKNLTLDIRTESGNDIVIEKRTNADDAEARRVAFERMAGAFRSATTGSARDKAKGAFVQAWFVYFFLSLFILADSRRRGTGSPTRTKSLLEEMSVDLRFTEVILELVKSLQSLPSSQSPLPLPACPILTRLVVQLRQFRQSDANCVSENQDSSTRCARKLSISLSVPSFLRVARYSTDAATT